MIHATAEELAEIQGVGEVLAGAFVTYFQDDKHVESLKRLLKELEIPKEEESESQQIFAGVTCYYRECGTFCKQRRGQGTD